MKARFLIAALALTFSGVVLADAPIWDELTDEQRVVLSQFDVALGYAPTRLLDASIAYSTFFPGDFIESTGADEIVRFLGIEVRFRY